MNRPYLVNNNYSVKMIRHYDGFVQLNLWVS